jgi:hypothetical protein
MVEIDGHWGFSSITHAIGSTVNSVSNAVSTAASTVADAASTAWNATTTWVSDHKAEIVGAVVGTVVGLGCEVATAGAGSLGCAALGGAVGNMVTYGMKTPSDQWTAGGFLTSGATGAAAGMVGFGAGKVLAAGGSKVISAFARDAAEGAESSAASTASRLVPDEGPSGPVTLLDTGAVIKFNSAQRLLQAGEAPVVNQTVSRELAEVGSRKGFSGTLPAGVSVIEDDVSMATRGMVMQQLRMFGAATRGIENDAAVGATSFGMGIPLITTDWALHNAVSKLGGISRYLAP